MKSNEQEFVESLLVLGLTLLGMFWGVFVFQTIWNWHIAPLGVIELGYFQAGGVSLAIGIPHLSTLSRLMKADSNKFADKVSGFFTGILSGFLIIGFGYLWLVLQ